MSPKPQFNASFGYIVYAICNCCIFYSQTCFNANFQMLLHELALALEFVGWLTKKHTFRLFGTVKNGLVTVTGQCKLDHASSCTVKILKHIINSLYFLYLIQFFEICLLFICYLVLFLIPTRLRVVPGPQYFFSILGVTFVGYCDSIQR